MLDVINCTINVQLTFMKVALFAESSGVIKKITVITVANKKTKNKLKDNASISSTKTLMS